MEGEEYPFVDGLIRVLLVVLVVLGFGFSYYFYLKTNQFKLALETYEQIKTDTESDQLSGFDTDTATVTPALRGDTGIDWTKPYVGTIDPTNIFYNYPVTDGGGVTVITSGGSGIDVDGTIVSVKDSDIDHNALQNTHNLTSDIDHNQLTNYLTEAHINWKNTNNPFHTTSTGQVDQSFSVGTSISASKTLNIQKGSLSLASDHYMAYLRGNKTDGASNYQDDLIGIGTNVVMDHSGGEIGYLQAGNFSALLSAGAIGAVGSNRNLVGLRAYADLDGGVVYGDSYSVNFAADQEAANQITGDLVGARIMVDADGTVDGDSYMVYLDERSNIDYGIYQKGTADNLFGGGVDINGVLDWSANPAKPKIYSQADEPNIGNDTYAFWTDTDDGKYYLILDIGGTQKKVELT